MSPFRQTRASRWRRRLHRPARLRTATRQPSRSCPPPAQTAFIGPLRRNGAKQVPPRQRRKAKAPPTTPRLPSLLQRRSSCCWRTASRCGTSSSRATSRAQATPASKTWFRRRSSAYWKRRTSAPWCATAAQPGACTSATCNGRWGWRRTCFPRQAPRTRNGTSTG